MTSAPFDPPLSNAERAALAARWNAHPGIQHMGVRIDLSAPDVVRVYVDPVQPHHRGGLGTDAVNGAVSGLAPLLPVELPERGARVRADARRHPASRCLDSR